MAFEKVIIKEVRTVVGKNNQTHKFLSVDLLQSHDLYLNDNMLRDNLFSYESLVGQEVLLPCSWGEYQGRPSLNLDGDGSPVVLSRSQPKSSTLSSIASGSK